MEFVRREVGGGARSRKPKVRIRYYTRAHRASTEWWFPSAPKKRTCPEKAGDREKARAGKRCLAAVCRHLGGVRGLGYWSGNEAVVGYFEERLRGEQVRPKIAGTNKYRDLTSCAFIYSSKCPSVKFVMLCRVF